MFCAPDSGNTEAYIKRSRPLAGDLALKHNVRTVLVAPPRAFPPLNHEVVEDPSGGLLPLQVVITHDVLQGLRDREAIFQHGLHGVEPSEFSETEKRDDRERERQAEGRSRHRDEQPDQDPGHRRSPLLGHREADSWLVRQRTGRPLEESTQQRKQRRAGRAANGAGPHRSQGQPDVK